MKCFYTLLFLLLWFFSPAQELEEYIKRYGIQSDSIEIHQKSRQFFHSGGNHLKWWSGMLESNNGDFYNADAIKFNVFENSIYVKSDGNYFRFPSTNVTAFTLQDANHAHKFERGFGEPRSVEVNVRFDTTVQAVTSFMLSFPKINELVVLNLNVETSGQLTLELESGLAGPIRELRLHMLGYLGIQEFDYGFANSVISESMYMEILHESAQLKLLKRHYKKSTQNQSISLVEHTSTHMFAQHDFYLARPTGEIKEIILTPSSIKGALKFVGVGEYPKLRRVRTEAGVVDWFRRNF